MKPNVKVMKPLKQAKPNSFHPHHSICASQLVGSCYLQPGKSTMTKLNAKVLAMLSEEDQHMIQSIEVCGEDLQPEWHVTESCFHMKLIDIKNEKGVGAAHAEHEKSMQGVRVEDS